jgi:GAF domain-containing protein
MVDEEAQEIVLTASAGQTDQVFEGYRLKIGEQGITGWVAGSGKPLLVNDVDQESRYHCVEGLTNTRSELALPIKLKEKVVGVMDVQSNRLNAFDEMDLSTLTTLADQVAIAIENARLLKETRKHVALLERTTRDLELVHQVSQVISSSLDLTHILEATVEQMVAVFEADHSGVLLFDQAQTHGQVVAEYPPTPTGATAEWFPVQGYLAAERIIADREPLVIKDTWNDPLMATVRETMHRLDIRSMLIAPLIVKGKVMGSIGLDAVGHQRCFDAEEVALAQTIANQVSIVIENARLFEETKQRAEEMTALHETTLDITAQLEMPRLLDAIIARASDLMGATGGMVHFYDPARERLVAVTSHNLEKDYTGLTLEAGEGVAGKVFQTGKPLIVDDHRTWAKKSSQVTDAEARSTLGMPLKWQGQIIGVLDIMDNVRVGAFDEHDLQRLAPFANQAAIAIQNARLFEETRRHAVQLEAASKVARDATAILDIGQLLDETVHLISDRFGFYHAGVFLVDEQREYALLRAASSKGGQCMLEQGHKLAVGKVGIVGYVAGTGEPRIVLDVGKDAVFFDNPNLPDTRSEMALPLISRGQIVGVLDIQSTQEAAFTEEDVVTLQTMADQLANAIENARLLEETQQRAQQLEALTEIGRAIGSTLDLDEVLQLILAQAERVVPYDAQHTSASRSLSQTMPSSGR